MAFTCGDGTGEPVRVRLTTKDVARQLLLDPEMSFGEAYTDERGSIADVLAIILNQPDIMPRWAKLLGGSAISSATSGNSILADVP